MERYEIERAVRRHTMPGIAKLLMLLLCSRINPRTGEIPDRWQPSLTELARESGHHRRTVMRYLTFLEQARWVTRHRPDPHAARTRHETTRYALHIPAQARGTAQPALEAGRSPAGGGPIPALEAGRSPAGGGGTRNSSDPSQTTDADIVISDDDLAAIAREEIAAAIGRPIGRAAAREIVRLVLAGRSPASPAAYLRAAIRDNPRRFLPAASPDFYRDYTQDRAHLRAFNQQEET